MTGNKALTKYLHKEEGSRERKSGVDGVGFGEEKKHQHYI